MEGAWLWTPAKKDSVHFQWVFPVRVILHVTGAIPLRKECCTFLAERNVVRDKLFCAVHSVLSRADKGAVAFRCSSQKGTNVKSAPFLMCNT
jgi:hypothetical protein